MQRRDSKDDWGKATVRNTIGGRRTAIRVVQDRLTGMVIVYEQEPVSLDGVTTLVFESPTSVVRLDRYPEHWRKLTDDALLAMRQPTS